MLTSGDLLAHVNRHSCIETDNARISYCPANPPEHAIRLMWLHTGECVYGDAWNIAPLANRCGMAKCGWNVVAIR